MSAYLLQEICHSFAVRTNETTRFKKLKDVIPRPVVHDLAFGEEHYVVKKLKRFRSWLEKGHDDGSIHDMAELRQTLDYLKCGGAV